MAMGRITSNGPVVATAIALAAVGALGIGDQTVVPPTAEYFGRISAAVKELPFSVDRWVGQDTDVTPSAQQLLKPNAIVQRRYIDPITNENFSVLVVHCGNTRDMQGHFPPVCYPAHGWDITGTERRMVTADGIEYPFTVYSMAYGSGLERETVLNYNYFVLPNKEGGSVVTPNTARLERLSHEAGSAALGSAQVQVLFSTRSSEAFRDEAFRKTLEALRPMLDEIASVPE